MIVMIIIGSLQADMWSLGVILYIMLSGRIAIITISRIAIIIISRIAIVTIHRIAIIRPPTLRGGRAL